MKPLVASLLLLIGCGAARAQQGVWQAPAGHTQMPIWPGAAPDQQPVAGPEKTELSGPNELIGGKRSTGVSNVTRPTMTIYPPVGKNTGAAVMVFPGGGYQMLAIDLEGTEVCDWITTRGVTCIVLKYRVTDVGPYPKSGPYPEAKMALEDAQRAIGLVRLHAAEWHIDPHKIGVLGFSAGGHLSAAISTHFEKRIYAPVDAADRLSCRPDFAVPIYPGHLSMNAAEYDATLGKSHYVVPGYATTSAFDREVKLNPDVPVTRATPPTFLLQNEDDHVDNVDDALSYYIALKNAGVPVEMHTYAQGGHAFGLRRTKLAVTAWPELVERWLVSIGMLPG